MKLVRYGAIGAEKPGLIDQNGDLRDLSSHVADIAGAALQDAELEKLRALDPNNLPLVDGSPRLGACGIICGGNRVGALWGRICGHDGLA